MVEIHGRADALDWPLGLRICSHYWIHGCSRRQGGSGASSLQPLLPSQSQSLCHVSHFAAKFCTPSIQGTAISMQRVLYDGLVEYPDGTPATTSQMAKDVVTFLSWASEPELDERKRMGLQTVIVLSTLLTLSLAVKRFKWSSIKTRRLQYQRSLKLLSISVSRALLMTFPYDSSSALKFYLETDETGVPEVDSI